MEWLMHWLDWHAIAADVRQHFWIYLSLPFVSAIIGYITKVVAIRMMFQPIEFVGLKPPTSAGRALSRETRRRWQASPPA